MARSPEWNPLADVERSTWVEAVEVASKNRLMLPAALRRRLAWASSPGTIPLLAVIEPDGSAELMPWKGPGEEEFRNAAVAVERAAAAEKPKLAVAAADRYLRFGLEGDGRTTLPFNLAVHLGTVADPLVRAVATGGRLWLWNEREWRMSRASRFEALLAAAGRRP